MIRQDATFCETPRLLDICKTCERHIAHKSNRKFKKLPDITVMRFKPEKTEVHEHCGGWVVFPIKGT